MLTLRQILNAALVRAKPLFDNFSLIQAFCNDIQTQIDGILTPPAGNEVTNARDYGSVLRDRLRGASKAQGNVVIEGGVVTAQGTPDMTVHIALGTALVDGVYCSWAAADTAAITAPVTNPRYDIVVINSDNTITVITGTEAASPVYPGIAASQRPLYAIPLIVGQTSIVTGDITDLRFKGSYDIENDEWNWLKGEFKRQIFTSSGTWVRPYGVDYVDVLCVGAGGAGGNGSTVSDSGAGGGGGGSGAVRKATLTVTGNISVTVGATGNTSFGTFVSTAGTDGSNASGVNGGNGGAGGGFGAGGGGGGGAGFSGTGSGGDGGNGGDYGLNGTNGDGAGGTPGTGGTSSGSGSFSSNAGGIHGTVISNGGASGGGGGAGYGGDGGQGGNGGGYGTGFNGGAGGGFGAGGGGGGGSGYGEGPGTGGAGGPGLCIVEWWE